MKYHLGKIVFSASDLMQFMGCRHATTLDLRHLKGDGPEPAEPSDDVALVRAHGDAHEAAYLAKLQTTGREIVEIPRMSLSESAEQTTLGLSSGAEILFQGAFLSGNWGGWADFLERVDKPSDLGNFSYEVADTKLKRRADPSHVLQLVLYSDLLEEVQGRAPEHAHLQLGDGRRETFRLADYQHYARNARARLEAFTVDPTPTRPEPCIDCAMCRWSNQCKSEWTKSDSLFLVANIRKTQVTKLEAAGIETLTELAENTVPLPKIAQSTLTTLTTQARLQHARKSGPPSFQLRASDPGKGFDLLPEPQPGDIFYDIEGDPFFDGGLEYLHGIWADDCFIAFWAHDHEAEAASLRDLLDYFRGRLAAYPKARIYHYAPYEITALKRLTMKYGIGEAFLDKLLREQRFVDLFAVVRGGIIASEPSYSIKDMEAFYDVERAGEVTTAGGSVVAYEKWITTQDQAILDEIEDYNRIDCISTEKLRDWLVSIRPDAPWPELAGSLDAADKEAEEDESLARLRSALAASDLSPERQSLLFDLSRFHAREKKPAQWAVFDAASKDHDELIEDLNALAGLEAISEVEPIKRSFQRRYKFPEQETKLKPKGSVTVADPDGAPKTLSIEEFDEVAREVTLKVGPSKDHLLASHLDLLPGWPLNTNVIEEAINYVIEDQIGEKRFSATDDLLERLKPRIMKDEPLHNPADDPLASAIDTISRMDNTVLPIQGPPGTGKTYVSARAILELVRQGHRVGVASNSHAAIQNVLMECLSALAERDLPIYMIHKVSNQSTVEYPSGCPIEAATNSDSAELCGDIVGGTAWFFAKEGNEQRFDWLFVDEAGQVSLANMIAMGRAARNIVLVGDPCQLPQVIQGSHPHPANLSCLEWILGRHQTIPPDRGLFLNITRRMHPDVCHFVSDHVYDGRLQSFPDTARQSVDGTPFPNAGTFWVPVEHEGNGQVAHEEVAAIGDACSDLLAGRWTDKDGKTREIAPEDIIVVAPYNAQVNALRRIIPAAIRVGTVDKFQGQEAPVCLVSMTASSAEDIPRGMEFLLSLNRINVAVSRAKGLALVFGSTRIREAKCTTMEQMKMVNVVCGMKQKTTW